MYIIRRNKGGKREYLCNDTARTFWYSLPKKEWMKAYENYDDAREELNRVKANYTSDWHYGIIKIGYSLADKAKYKFPPIDAGPIDPSITTI